MISTTTSDKVFIAQACIAKMLPRASPSRKGSMHVQGVCLGSVRGGAPRLPEDVVTAAILHRAKGFNLFSRDSSLLSSLEVQSIAKSSQV